MMFMRRRFSLPGNLQRPDEYFSRNSAARSSLSDKVKGMRRDVKKKMARLRGTTEGEGEGEGDTAADSEHTQQTTQPAVSSSSSHSSMSLDEEAAAAAVIYKGPILARARVISDYTPSPYDKEAIPLKKGEIVYVISMSETGMWKGFVNNRIGHFKFIHVEVLVDERTRSTLRKQKQRERRVSRRAKPRTVEELLTRLGLQSLIPLFLMHGYDSLQLFSELEEEDLNELQVASAEDRAKILTAAQMLADYDNQDSSNHTADESPLHDACPSPSTSCDSPHHTSAATTVSKDSGCSSGESTLKQDKPKDTPPEKEWLQHLPDKLMTTSANGSTLTKAGKKDAGEEDNKEFLQDDQEIISITSNGEIRIEREDGVCYTSTLCSGEAKSDEAGKLSNGRHICEKHRRLLREKSSPGRDPKSDGCGSMKRSQSVKEQQQASPPVPVRHRPQVPCRTTSLTPGTSPSHLGSETMRSVSTQSVVQRRHRRSGSPVPSTDLISSGLASSPKVKTATVRQLSSPVGRRLMSSSPPLSPSHRVSSPERGSLSRSTGTLTRRTSGGGGGGGGGSPDRVVSPRSSGGLHTHRTPRPMSVTLESLMISKLQDEQIDLSTQPYTDKAGFCGIPPALVVRYAEELRRDVHDVALALDSTRGRLLQTQCRPWVPNDFLSSACAPPFPPPDTTSLNAFFTSLGLPMYTPVFLRHGYGGGGGGGGVRSLLGLSSPADLRALGVHNPRHAQRITEAIAAAIPKSDTRGQQQQQRAKVTGPATKVTDKV